MRMPFFEFLTSGDLKFIIVFIIFSLIAIYYFIKKLQDQKSESQLLLIDQHNTKITNAANWILISSVLSLLLGLMHSFYFMGKAEGIATKLIYSGVSYALITPVLGVCLSMGCKILSGVFNPKMTKF